jgi:hypothetical protein
MGSFVGLRDRLRHADRLAKSLVRQDRPSAVHLLPACMVRLQRPCNPRTAHEAAAPAVSTARAESAFTAIGRRPGTSSSDANKSCGHQDRGKLRVRLLAPDRLIRRASFKSVGRAQDRTLDAKSPVPPVSGRGCLLYPNVFHAHLRQGNTPAGPHSSRTALHAFSPTATSVSGAASTATHQEGF